MTHEPYISPKLREAIQSHLVGNLLIRDTDSPLILGVFGPPGEGKTFQINTVCNQMGINQIILSPGELESPAQSGGGSDDPIAMLRKKYIKAGSATGSTPEGGYMNRFASAAMVINDVDTVLGDWGPKVEYSSNRQLLYGELMSLCDFPTLVARQPVKRVPIIMTGNDASILYAPLLRSGRMRLFKWAPTVVDKAMIVSRIFSGIPPEEIEKLIELYPDKPVAFWNDVNSRYHEDILLEWLRTRTIDDIRNDFYARREYSRRDITPHAHAPLNAIHYIADEFHKNDVRKESFL